MSELADALEWLQGVYDEWANKKIEIETKLENGEPIYELVNVWPHGPARNAQVIQALIVDMYEAHYLTEVKNAYGSEEYSSLIEENRAWRLQCAAKEAKILHLEIMLKTLVDAQTSDTDAASQLPKE